LIQIDQDQGNLDQALADLDTVLRISPDDPDLQVDRAKVLGELGRLDESAAAFTIAAQALLATRDVPRAIDACHRAKNLLPRSPDPHRYLAKAYLLDGQTDSALVEYKSLWHALLSQDRPQKALELFKGILDSDCRFGGIKQQALDHAQNSEAVKTSQATRLLIYIACGLVLVVAVFVSIQFYQDTVVKDKARSRLAVFKNTLPARLNSGEHVALLDELADMRKAYASFDVISEDIDRQASSVRDDFEKRADVALQAANALLASAKFEQARAAYENLCARYPDTRAAHSAKAQIEQVRLGAIGAQVEGIIKDAQARWANFDWDVALATVKPLADRKELPADIKARVATIIADWQGKLADSTALTGRADAMVRAGRRMEALDGYRRAIAAGGIGVAQAMDRLTTLELTLARELVAQAQDAFAHDDDRSAFRTLDELGAIVKVSTSRDLRRYVDTLGLPFVVKVDSPLTGLAVRRATAGEQFVRAPAGTTGPWMYRLLYVPAETVSIEARRTGFTPQTVVVNYQGRRSSAGITLARGPLWRAELEGAAVTAPVAGGKTVLVGTDRSSLEVLDPGIGAHRPISLPQSVDEFRAAPFIFQGNAWVVLDHRLWGIDLATRAPVLTWPAAQTETRLRLNGSLWVQEHELIPGQVLTVLGGANGILQVQAVDRGRVIPYPAVSLGGDLTGSMAGAQVEIGRTLLFVPVGSQVQVFDTTAATEHAVMTPLYVVRTRGDIVGTPVPAQVAERRAMLALDASGLLVALGVVPAEAPEDQRAIGSWVLEGTGVDRAAVAANRAVVALSEGRVVAVDLAKPGQILWRFPSQGSMGALAGAPVIGKRGVYVADANGTLHCLDVDSGVEKWRADLGNPVRTGILAYEGHVYVPTRNGVVACFEEGDE
jgi:tetratricopeptide (TPR) repeat protein